MKTSVIRHCPLYFLFEQHLAFGDPGTDRGGDEASRGCNWRNSIKMIYSLQKKMVILVVFARSISHITRPRSISVAKEVWLVVGLLEKVNYWILTYGMVS